ncbi:cytochrome c3 family protein [Granulosicoccus antarcticus]|uniref:Class III cytochrome C domain-containing protein n=1 Tax=Granulosicoccus antarcticus IMCC3135 TaxID=1192854 RepID=A0A2Z2NU43_9GAMM|nr:cytochrome c3 family protein [Granulosicoccus antarcticus]ASJ74015.1 hypothetical protein IMCC3135_19680 [Granulosicoccus antarcticus IMCC3135]
MKPVLQLVLLLALLIFGWLMLASTQFYQSLNQQVRYQPNLPMTFAHTDHAKQQCLQCHHNFGDNTGSGLCLDCHVREMQTSLKLEEQFHGLCRGCHEEKLLAGEAHGPVRACADCHIADIER